VLFHQDKPYQPEQSLCKLAIANQGGPNVVIEKANDFAVRVTESCVARLRQARGSFEHVHDSKWSSGGKSSDNLFGAVGRVVIDNHDFPKQVAVCDKL